MRVFVDVQQNGLKYRIQFAMQLTIVHTNIAGWHQTMTSINAGLLPNGPSKTNYNEISTHIR